MSQSILFSTYLHDLMTAQKISEDHLVQELNYRTNIYVRSWLNGLSRPHLWELPALATVLNADPVEMTVGWLIDQLPEMEDLVWAEVLQPRGSTFPRSDDLALRAPRAKKRVSTW